jgi:outer membrane immunogenic protein
MRRLSGAVILIASVSGALAQEYELPTLRGSEPIVMEPVAAAVVRPPWGGFYAGGQVSHSSATVNFGRGVGDLAGFLVRNSVLEAPVSSWTTLPQSSTSSNGFGVFFGYNSRWEELVLGWEVNYTHTSLRTGANDSLALLYANDAGAPTGHHFVYDVGVSGSASVRVTDLLTFRGRAGWTAGNFLPYAFIAPGFARIDVARSATVAWIRTDYPDATTPPTPPITPIPTAFGGGTNSDVKNGGYYFVYAGGLGVDIEIMPRAFLRFEWENLQIPNVKSMSVGINSLRAGGALRF